MSEKKRERETREINENRENHQDFRDFRLFRVFRVLSWTLAVCVFSAFTQTTATSVNRQRLETITRRLSSPEFNGRAFKTEGGRKAAAYLVDLFRESGVKTVARGDSYLQQIPGGGVNVVGMIEGRDPARQDEFVIISAHYDAFGGKFAGANDNAAGAAAMMEIARLAVINRPQRSLVFIAFDGEEQNSAGAKFYAERPLVSLEKTVAAIKLTGFGGGMSERLYETLYVMGAEFSTQLREAVGKYKRDESQLAIVGSDVMRWPGGEHYQFPLKQTPALVITNGVHYSYHSKSDTPDRINYPALEKHVATLAKVILEIANHPQKIERQTAPLYDSDEATEWRRLLSALRENVIKTPQNDAGLTRIDEVLLELERFNDRPVQDPKEREAVILRASNICFYIANPNAVEYNSLHDAARSYEGRGERQQAIAAYQKLLRFIEEGYRRDDRTVGEIRERLAKLGGS